MLPHYAWNETVIKDMLGVDIQEISDVIILSPVECMVYSGQCSRGQGFTQAEATEIARRIHDSHTMWIGRRVRMRCIPRTLRDAKVDLKTAKDISENARMESWVRVRLRDDQAIRGPSTGNFTMDANRGRRMVQHSDRYLADQYLRRERREGRAHATWPEESARQDSATAWVQHHTEVPEAQIGMGTGPDRRRAGAGRRYPLGRHRLEDIPQSVRDPFHSVQEDQWDSPLESLPNDSDEESDDIVAYDITTSRYTNRTNGTGEKEEITACSQKVP